MVAIQTNTQEGPIVIEANSDLSASIGCFAHINSSGKAILPSANGMALYVINDAYTEFGTTYRAQLQPLDGSRNVRVIAGGTIAAAANVTTNSSGKAVTASTGGNILAIAEEAGVSGQYILLRPLGGIQTA